jgi:LL-H family phage holin
VKDLTPILNAVITLIVSIITVFVIPWLKEKIEAEKLEKYKEWVTIAVRAAEQIYKGTGRGAEKKEYVISFLKSKGLAVDMDSIENMIEAAVLELNKAVEAKK